MPDFFSDKRVVNVVPAPESQGVSVVRPVSLSVRGTQTYIDPTKLFITAGYAKVFSRASDFFDKDLPRTQRKSFFLSAIAQEPNIGLIGDPPSTLQIIKTSNSSQNASYFTTIDGGSGFKNVMVSAVLRPDSIAITSNSILSGTILGLENGPKNTAVYLLFQNDGNKQIIVSGPIGNSGVVIPVEVIPFDWSDLTRYTIIWNESRRLIQIYAGNFTRIGSFTFDLFNPFSISTLKHTGAADLVAVYGQEGQSGNASTWDSVCITDDVAYPLIGIIRPGNFVTTVKGAESVNITPGVDLLTDPVIPWFIDQSIRVMESDPLATTSIVNNVFRVTKNTSDSETSFVLFRDEPSFVVSGSGGLYVDFEMLPVSVLKDAESTGMGVIIYDGRSVFILTFLDDTMNKTIGILTRGGQGLPRFIGSYILPSTNVDWSSPVSLRFLVDVNQSKVRLYALPDVDSPIIDVPLNRGNFPEGGDFNYTDIIIPFIGIGFPIAQQTVGSLNIYNLRYGHFYQTWEATSGKVPNDVATDPQWIKQTVGSAPNPTTPITDFLDLTCSNCTLKYTREAPLNFYRGGILETRIQILSSERGKRTGDYAVLDDGEKAYMLTFVDVDEGKFACLCLGDSISQFKEVAGRSGLGADVSFPIDWSQLHTYRLERRPREGVFIFVDGEKTPRVSFPENRIDELPVSFSNLNPTIMFGHLVQDVSSTTRWRFVRGIFSAGYDISFKKNLNDVELIDDLFGTQGLVLVDAEEKVTSDTSNFAIFDTPQELQIFVSTSPLVNTIIEIVFTDGHYVLFFD